MQARLRRIDLGESLARVVLSLCAFAVGACLAASADTAGAPDRPPRGRALLVGCTYYPNLPEGWWLQGPLNDVALMRTLLEERFALDPTNIVTLAGWPGDERLRPVRANIIRELDALREDSGPGDMIVIHLAGHGSQQPADDDPTDPEPDGLDEIFLPADVGEWDGERGRVENAIVDDEIRIWLAAIAAKGASVWLIADACHSGTLIRGTPSASHRERRIPPGRLVPKSVLAATRGSSDSPSILDGPVADNVVAMYAAQPHEVTQELPLPQSDGRYHGLFTYSVARVLAGAASSMTYRELTDRVAVDYRAMGRLHPTPLVEGGGIDRQVLGLEEWPGRSRLLLTGNRPGGGARFELNGGFLQGLRRDSILAVFPPAGTMDAEQRVGYVRIAALQPTLSLVEPVKYDGRDAPAPDDLLPGSRCSVVYVDYGEMRLRLVLQSEVPCPLDESTSVLTTHPSGEGPRAVEEALIEASVASGRLFERVADPLEADWFVRLRADEILLVPSSGWSAEFATAAAPDEMVPRRFRLKPSGRGGIRPTRCWTACGGSRVSSICSKSPAATALRATRIRNWI